eukprot:9734698-Heterocapsa_arctica.AAC.1
MWSILPPYQDRALINTSEAASITIPICLFRQIKCVLQKPVRKGLILQAFPTRALSVSEQANMESRVSFLIMRGVNFRIAPQRRTSLSLILSLTPPPPVHPCTPANG